MLMEINQCFIQLPNWHRAKRRATTTVVVVVVVPFKSPAKGGGAGKTLTDLFSLFNTLLQPRRQRRRRRCYKCSRQGLGWRRRSERLPRLGFCLWRLTRRLQLQRRPTAETTTAADTKTNDGTVHRKCNVQIIVNPMLIFFLMCVWQSELHKVIGSRTHRSADDDEGLPRSPVIALRHHLPSVTTSTSGGRSGLDSSVSLEMALPQLKLAAI